jgi:DNA-binding SARP family transcriptional activator/Tfp pilus assembly protein PilF
MEFRILGTLEVRVGGERLAIGGPSEQKILAVLLLAANRVVPLAGIVDALWEDDPPATAPKQAQNAVSRLRRLLAAAGEPQLVVTEGAGYRLSVADGSLDAQLFSAGVEQAQECAGRGQRAQAAEILRSALALWRGPALAGLGGEVIQAAATAWNERRYVATEAYYDHQLALARHCEVVGELLALVTEHPLREQPVGQLMIALYRSGRRADALSVYSDARARLAAELGLDPGPELQRLHQQVLTADPALATPEVDGGRSGTAVSPRLDQLPHDVRAFTGRDNELRELDALLASLEAGGGGGVIAAIDGLAGVGKTSLAIHWAHRVSSHFPAGALYLDLRGHDPYQSPMGASEALGHLLDAMGVPPDEVPSDVEARGRAYRSALGGGRWLVVLDNAASAAQVRPALPGCLSVLTMVTSRPFLGGLVATEGAYRIAVLPLTIAEAQGLMSAIVGPERAADDSSATLSLINACGRLPLALRVAAARLVADPGRPVADLAAHLTSDRRLDELRLDDDDRAAVPAAFDLSYQALSSAAQRTFVLMGALPARRISEEAMVAASGEPADLVTLSLTELTRSGLVHTLMPGRFGMHDLVRHYAARLAERWAPTGAADARRRLVVWFLAGTQRAVAALALPRLLVPPPDDPPDAQSGPQNVTDAQSARDWLETERAELAATIRFVAEHDPHPAVWRLALELRGFFRVRRYAADWVETGAAALQAARTAGVAADRAATHHNLGHARWSTGEYDEATHHYQQALAESRLAHWLPGEAGSLSALGSVWHEQGRFEAAIGCYRQALELDDSAMPLPLRLITVGSLGLVHQTIGHPRAAIKAFSAAMALAEELHATDHIATCLGNLGLSYLQLGDLGHARDLLNRALLTYREVGSRNGEANVLSGLATLNAGLGRYDEAAFQATLAVRIARDIKDRRIECDALLAAGSVLHQRGDPDGARRRLTDAMDVGRLIGYERGLAPVLARLAAVELALGEPQQAAALAEEALLTSRRCGDCVGEAAALIARADVCLSRGAYAAARQDAQDAARVCADAGLAGQHASAARTLDAINAAVAS